MDSVHALRTLGLERHLRCVLTLTKLFHLRKVVCEDGDSKERKVVVIAGIGVYGVVQSDRIDAPDDPIDTGGRDRSQRVEIKRGRNGTTHHIVATAAIVRVRAIRVGVRRRVGATLLNESAGAVQDCCA